MSSLGTAVAFIAAFILMALTIRYLERSIRN